MEKENNVVKKIITKENIDNLFNSEVNNPSYIRAVIVILSFLIIGLFFVFNFNDDAYESHDLRIAVGNIWESQQLVAEFNYPIYKPQSEYLSDRQKAADNSLPVFLFDSSIEEAMYNKLSEYINILSELTENSLGQFDFPFSEKAIKPILNMNATQKINELKKIEKRISQYLQQSYNSGFTNISAEKMTANEISVKTASNEYRIIPVSNLTDKNLFLINAEKTAINSISPNMQALALEIISKLNTPNLTFNKELTDKSIELSINSVPRTRGYVKKGEIIVQNGEKLTNETIEKINSYRSSTYMQDDSSSNILYYIGGFGHSAIILTILILYLIIIRRRIFKDNIQLLILMLILIITSALAWLSVQIHTPYPIELLITIPSFAMLVAIVYDSRTAFYVTVTMALLVAGIRGNDYITGIIMIFTGGIAAYTVRDIQSRTQMYQSIFYIFIGFVISLFLFGADTQQGISDILNNLVLAFINSLMAPLLTFGLLFFIERFSDISTDLRIKEFDNLDHPLMQLLAEKAPGTYQHTLAVAILAERCAREIDANPLLVKVGTYFHDLGKTARPEYFTENQIPGENKHDNLTPKKSAKIIIDHVTEGLKLAYEHNLPQRIIDFIAMHHGTTLVKHFYAKALEEAEDKSDVLESDFRYPGPKPRTKEAAILMICDSAEAISRLDNKTIEEIEAIIDNTIRDRINDGQFNECEITLHELSKVKEIIAKSIVGMVHKRVSYKEIPKN